MTHYLILPDGSTVWPVTRRTQNAEVFVELADGTEQPITLTSNTVASSGGYGKAWMFLPAGSKPVRVFDRTERTVIDGHELIDPDTESTRFPARLTRDEFNARCQASYDDPDDDDNEAAALLRRLYRQAGTHTETVEHPTAEGLDTWQQVKAPTTEWMDPDPEEAWLPSPVGSLFGPAFSWLFPGAVHLPDALERAIRSVFPRVEIHRRNYDTSTEFSAWFELAYDPPRTTTETVGKGRRKTTVDRPSFKKVHREFRVPNWVAGHDKPDAIVKRVAVVEQLIDEHVPFALVCSHCNGEGWITTTNKRNRP